MKKNVLITGGNWSGKSEFAEIRMVETILEGKPKTPFMKFGDTTRIEMKDDKDQSIFGKIEQQVKKFNYQTIIFDNCNTITQ